MLRPLLNLLLYPARFILCQAPLLLLIRLPFLLRRTHRILETTTEITRTRSYTPALGLAILSNPSHRTIPWQMLTNTGVRCSEKCCQPRLHHNQRAMALLIQDEGPARKTHQCTVLIPCFLQTRETVNSSSHLPCTTQVTRSWTIVERKVTSHTVKIPIRPHLHLTFISPHQYLSVNHLSHPVYQSVLVE